MEEKRKFWSKLDEVIEHFPREGRVVMGVDFNGYVGEGNIGDEEVMGRFSCQGKEPGRTYGGEFCKKEWKWL